MPTPTPTPMPVAWRVIALLICITPLDVQDAMDSQAQFLETLQGVWRLESQQERGQAKPVANENLLLSIRSGQILILDLGQDRDVFVAVPIRLVPLKKTGWFELGVPSNSGIAGTVAAALLDGRLAVSPVLEQTAAEDPLPDARNYILASEPCFLFAPSAESLRGDFLPEKPLAPVSADLQGLWQLSTQQEPPADEPSPDEMVFARLLIRGQEIFLTGPSFPVIPPIADPLDVPRVRLGSFEPANPNGRSEIELTLSRESIEFLFSAPPDQNVDAKEWSELFRPVTVQCQARDGELSFEFIGPADHPLVNTKTKAPFQFTRAAKPENRREVATRILEEIRETHLRKGEEQPELARQSLTGFLGGFADTDAAPAARELLRELEKSGLRTWTSRNGQQKQIARLIRKVRGKVLLQNREGEEESMRISDFSEADQEYIRKWSP